ncbi:DUF2785 domain-containing protein [Streptomyces sp. NPDC012769]|uniref:DUF2785 domain-containing protein n=1 Tax=Streptomyces sp. NPDC012769 TaxID=3364848 RepID=UPI0036848283
MGRASRPLTEPSPVGQPIDVLTRELSRALADPDPLVRRCAVHRPRDLDSSRGHRGVPAAGAGGRDGGPFHRPAGRGPHVRASCAGHAGGRGGFQARLGDALERWYPGERDPCGYDGMLGWLRAVAHGAGLHAGFGRHPEVAPVRMLNLAAARPTAPTDHVWDQLEDDRLARAIARMLTFPA